MMRQIWLAALLAAACAIPAHADVVISAGPTKNMICSNGICKPTANNAVLNSYQVESLLLSGNLTVKTRGPASVNATNIVVKSGFRWFSPYTLTFNDVGTTIDKKIAVRGAGGFNQVSDKLFFGPQGSIYFAETSSVLTIGGIEYNLVKTLPALISDINAVPRGAFALANSYNAQKDGTYSASPITKSFAGLFNGLGNTISSISVNATSGSGAGGLFQDVSTGGVVSFLRLLKVSVVSSGAAGGIAYQNYGTIRRSSVTGEAYGNGGDAGGIIADDYGVLQSSYSEATVSGTANVGGVVGLESGLIGSSFAMSYVTGQGDSGTMGGLVGLVSGNGSVANSYSTSEVAANSGANAGGLIGEDTATTGSTQYCYSIGSVSGGGIDGGFIGVNSGTKLSDDYWDTDTSGTSVGVGAGNSRGVKGLTTQQFQSGLPAGFDPKIWAENANINNGFPYLIANPPP